MTSAEELYEEEDQEEISPPGPQPWRGPQIKLNKFGGSRSEYRGWRDEVQAILLLHSVPEDKQVFLLDPALEAGKGRPRDLFPSLTVDEVNVLTTFDVWKSWTVNTRRRSTSRPMRLLRSTRSASERLGRACATT